MKVKCLLVSLMLSCSLWCLKADVHLGFYDKTCPNAEKNVYDYVKKHVPRISHCQSFSNRLYNFTGKGDQDPSLDSIYAANLKKKNKCKYPKDTATIVEMDPGSFRTFDLRYYEHLLQRRGLFQSDAALTTNKATESIIIQILDNPLIVL